MARNIKKMSIKSREEYLGSIREKYFKGSKKEKQKILDEYCENTGHERKYVIKKLNYKVKIKKEDKVRNNYYDGEVKEVLVKLWEIFDRPCGYRLEPLIKKETDRLIGFKEIYCLPETRTKLLQISASTIDRKLKHTKEIIGLQEKYQNKKNNLFSQSIPVKTSADQSRELLGNIQVDLVEHCGDCAIGTYINSLSGTDIFSGWWEGEGCYGKSQEATVKALEKIKLRMPVNWREIHFDNGTNFINYHLVRYAQKEHLDLSRSRPYKKNDNCFVEQKNSTHVRAIIGYLRYDTKEELDIINDLYGNELRLYKNFFQPVIKLKNKVRFKGKIHRQYDKAKTPYQRLMESKQTSKTVKQQLKATYEILNPAQLKRQIDYKLKQLNLAYDYKKGRIKKSNFGVDFKRLQSMISVS